MSREFKVVDSGFKVNQLDDKAYHYWLVASLMENGQFCDDYEVRKFHQGDIIAWDLRTRVRVANPSALYGVLVGAVAHFENGGLY